MNAQDTSHASYDALAAGHALSALEPEDELLFRTHLEQCAVCQRAVIEHTETLGHLAYDAVSEAPPASVLEGIREGVAASGRGGDFPAPLPLEHARARRAARPVRRYAAVLGAAAGLVLVVALVFVNRGPSAQERDAQLAAQRLSTTVSSLLVPGARKIELAGAGGRGAVIVNGKQVSLVVSGVAVNDKRTSIYVLWEQTTFGDVRAVGAFDVSSKNLAVINDLRLDGSSDAVKTFMVTKESGRRAPVRSTQTPIVSGDA